MQLRDEAVEALTALSHFYYKNSERTAKNDRILEKYLIESRNDIREFERMGFVSAIGALPNCILTLRTDEVLKILMSHSLAPVARHEFFAGDASVRPESSNVNNWAEARRDSVKALINAVLSIGFDGIDDTTTDRISQCFLKALQEYTVDDRGDIGAWVREAAMDALYKFITTIPNEQLDDGKVHAVVAGLIQQAVEKINRTRAIAGKLFCRLVYQ